MAHDGCIDDETLYIGTSCVGLNPGLPYYFIGLRVLSPFCGKVDLKVQVHSH